jgi:branched-chain amino acid transport system permease protein
MNMFGLDFGKKLVLGDYTIPSVTMYYYLFLVLVVVSVVICHRLETSRIGRAWMAIREDEIAAKAMGINTRNMKLLAFGMGATFRRRLGSMFAAFQGFRLARVLQPARERDDRGHGGAGRHGPPAGRDPGRRDAGRAARGAALRGGPLQQATGGRLDASILRQLLIALAMIVIMLSAPRGLWPARRTRQACAHPREHRALKGPRHERNRSQGAGRQQALRRPAGAVRRGHHHQQGARSTA